MTLLPALAVALGLSSAAQATGLVINADVLDCNEMDVGLTIWCPPTVNVMTMPDGLTDGYPSDIKFATMDGNGHLYLGFDGEVVVFLAQTVTEMADKRERTRVPADLSLIPRGEVLGVETHGYGIVFTTTSGSFSLTPDGRSRQVPRAGFDEYATVTDRDGDERAEFVRLDGDAAVMITSRGEVEALPGAWVSLGGAGAGIALVDAEGQVAILDW